MKANQPRVEDLRHRVTIQRRGQTADAGWIDEATVWAAVEPLSVQATIAARQASQSYTHKVTIRYRRGVAAGYRIVYDGKSYEIVSTPIDKEERHRFLQLLCVEMHFTDPQMSQLAQIHPCIGYGRHAPEYGPPVEVVCRIEQQPNSNAAKGYFPLGTTIKPDDKVFGDEGWYLVEFAADDRGVSSVAHVEVSLRGL